MCDVQVTPMSHAHVFPKKGGERKKEGGDTGGKRRGGNLWRS